MIHSNLDESSLTNHDHVDSSLENLNETHAASDDTVIVQGTKFTKEEIEQANKPQRHVILETIGGSGIAGTGEDGGSIRDNERVSNRANEAPDPTDTNTGGIAAGGAKGASQS